jgi:hypothetical protein
LATIHYLTSRLEQTPILSSHDLARAVAQCDRHGGVRLPAGYLGKWLHQRLKPIVAVVEREGVLIEVTVEMVEEFLGGVQPDSGDERP